MAKKRLVVGNWKMYVESAEVAEDFATTLRRKVRGLVGVEAWLAPSLTLLPTVADTLSSSPVKVGAQTISAFQNGAHTGDVSGCMLREAGALFSIVGHSERRAAGESNNTIREQLQRASEAGLTAVLCVGERERDPESGAHFEDIALQLTSALRDPQAVPSAKTQVKKLIIAYEPVWAIGKAASDVMSGAELEEVVIFIKKTLAELVDRKTALRVPILYGGSVDATNASELLTAGGISGFLVGRASTDVESFFSILKACKR